ncbi:MULTISPECIES: tetratricopeptide repeat protein [Vitreoscilla]|uniref:Tetratricopeptide repeat protein n=1 Tax=Vitreoscilla stercoraria TaxID=61 RepID=A0ABY4EAA9_VITST|nr:MULTISPECIES: tetratricopeptide repeat protein [Vitreoscilla]AUZ05936.2 hypothetical protein ADP71_26510 [Vitreoscilla sp. C1]UOO92695.1 hypothetical protein LVJ81_01190 [Vitreoscilla stercoraria]
MASWQQRLLPMALGLTLLSTGTTWAQTVVEASQADTNTVQLDETISPKTLSPEAKKARAAAEEKLRLQQVTQDANAFSGMIASELALLEGNTRGALGAYAVLFERTGRPEMAERAIQISIGQGAYAEAQILLDRWRKIEPVPTVLQRQVAWELSAARGDAKTALANLNDVLPYVDDIKIKRMFLLLAQLSLSGGEVAHQGYDTVRNAVKNHANLPEAAVAEAMFAALSNHDKEAIAALNRLAKLDADISPATQVVIGILAQRKPELVSQFFAQADSRYLSDVWRELQIDALVKSEQFEQAYQLIQQELSQNPRTELQIQAGILAMKKNDYAAAEAWLQRAYQNGNVEERNRVATLLAVLSFGQKKNEAAMQWTDKIDAPAFQFDKSVILATAAAERKDWDAMRKALDLAKDHKPTGNHLYDEQQWRHLELMWISKQAPNEAYAQYTQLIEAQLKSASPNREVLADLYAERGILLADKFNRPEEAMQDLGKQLQLRPDSADAMNALGYTMLSNAASREQGFVLLERAFKLSPQAPHINDSLGWAYFLKGQPEKALAYLKFAYEKYPDAEVAAHLVETYHALGDEKNARALAKQGWKLNPEHPVLLDTLKRLNLLPNKEVQP